MQEISTITRYKPGSLRELLALACPLIAVALSDNLMVFFDRIILAHYSLTALNATTLSSQLIELFQYALWAIATLVEIHVAKLYTNKYLTELTKPCWQMIYLSLATLPLVLLLCVFSSHWILHGEYLAVGQHYYQTLLFSIPLTGIIAALASFFVGQGKTKLVLYSTIAANLINIALDLALVFGIPGYIPALGPIGAALSSIIALSLQVVLLFFIFLSPHNRKRYKTHRYAFDVDAFFDLLKTGLPIATSHISETAGWFVLMIFASHENTLIFTVINVGSTIILAFAFFIDGLYRAVCTLSASHISQQHNQFIKKTFKASIKLLLASLIVLAIPLLVYPSLILRLFNLANTSSIWHNAIFISLACVWLYLLLSGLLWMVSAVLTVKKDTRFLMIANVSTIWLLTVVPFYILAQYDLLQVTLAWLIIDSYVIAALALALLRYIKLSHRDKLSHH